MTDRKTTCVACKSAITKGDIANADLEFGGKLKATNQPEYTADADTDLVATVGTLDEYTPMVRTSGTQVIGGSKTFLYTIEGSMRPIHLRGSGNVTGYYVIGKFKSELTGVNIQGSVMFWSWGYIVFKATPNSVEWYGVGVNATYNPDALFKVAEDRDGVKWLLLYVHGNHHADVIFERAFGGNSARTITEIIDYTNDHLLADPSDYETVIDSTKWVIG